MNGEIVKFVPKNDQSSYEELHEKLRSSGICDSFSMYQIVLPVYEFSHEIAEHVVNNGFSSLFNYTVTMEDVTSPSMTTDDIEKIILKFISKLGSPRKLIIIDPYFYSASNKIDTVKLFDKLINPVLENLDQITFITNGKRLETKSDIHSLLKNSKSGIAINDVVTDEFHDRFWIDPENNVGLVMGTSLNGIGNKISLVDVLSPPDVRDISNIAKSLGVSF